MTLRTLRLVRAGEAAGDVRGGCAKAARARYRYGTVLYNTVPVPVKRHRGEPGHTMYRYIVRIIRVSMCPCVPCVPCVSRLPPFYRP